MGLIDRMDLLSGCGGLQGAEQQARARDTVSLSAIATFVTAPLVERAELFLTGYSCSSPPIYHTEELNVDTSKYFHTQGSPGACVFSLFKMEKANPSLAVCDGNRNLGENSCMCVHVSERASVHVSMHALITRSYSCVRVSMRVWFVHVRCTVKIRGQSNAFSASKYHDWNIYCLHTFDKSCCSASHCTEKSSPMFKQICSFSMSVWWMCSIDFVREAKTIETKTNAWSVKDNKAAFPDCVTLLMCVDRKD